MCTQRKESIWNREAEPYSMAADSLSSFSWITFDVWKKSLPHLRSLRFSSLSARSFIILHLHLGLWYIYLIFVTGVRPVSRFTFLHVHVIPASLLKRLASLYCLFSFVRLVEWCGSISGLTNLLFYSFAKYHNVLITVASQ